MSRAPRWLHRLQERIMAWMNQPATLHECSDPRHLNAVREDQQRLERRVQQMESEAETRLHMIDLQEDNIRRER